MTAITYEFWVTYVRLREFTGDLRKDTQTVIRRELHQSAKVNKDNTIEFDDPRFETIFKLKYAQWL